MLVEIRPGQLTNKGGELMLRAALDELQPAHAVATEHWIAPYPVRAGLGLYQKVWFRSLGPLAGLPGRLLPSRVRRIYGLVTEAEIDAIIDAAGFAYSDQFSIGKTAHAARMARRWRRQGKRLVLLPQAFGPFEHPRTRAAAREILENADLVFARDEVSLRHLHGLGAAGARVTLAPDFTIAIRSTAAERPNDGGPAYVVPNEKVITHGGQARAAGYLEFLVSVVNELARRQIGVAILLHETADRRLADRLRAATEAPPAIIDGLNALHLRELIGGARLVVGSRYHALVSALAQGVPVLATGWSHKYASLLSDFGCPELLVEPPVPTAHVVELLDRLTDDAGAMDFRQRILRRGDELRTAIRDMWTAVHDVLASGGSRAS